MAETGQTQWEVVGVVGDVQVTALDTDSPPVVYLSHLQMPENRLTLVLRTGLGVASVTRQHPASRIRDSARPGRSPNSIRRLILKDAMLVSGAGIGLGGIIAALVTRSMQAVVFGLAASDWRVYGVVITGVLASAVLATVGPVRRAGSVDLGVLLRAE